MKKPVILFLFIGLFTSMVFADADQYVEAMREKIKAVYAAETIPDLQEAVNGLERIAKAEKTKWEPFYYASFGYIKMANRESDGAKKDALLDLAKTAIDQASAIHPDDSEIAAMEGFLHTIRITVDPMTRGPKYSVLAMQSYQKALTLNPKNARAMMLLAQLQFGTAAFFQQAPTEACATAAKARVLYESDKSDNPLAPTWGKDATDELIKNCP